MEANRPRIPKIKLTTSLKKHFNYASLLEDIVNEVKKIPLLDELRMSKDLTQLLCIIAEDIKFPKSKDNKVIDKKTLVLEVLSTIYQLTAAEQAVISSDIEFIVANDLHIVKKSICGRFSSFFFAA